MDNDASAVSFDTFARESGQFGFFQKRLFLINTLIQSACVSVLLYTCACMPEVDNTEKDDNGKPSGQYLVISQNGYHYGRHDSNFNDTFKREQSSHLPLSSLNGTTASVAALDVIYQTLSTITSTMRSNISLNQLVSITSIGNTSVERVLEKLKGTIYSTTAFLEHFTENVTNIASATSAVFTSGTNMKLATSVTLDTATGFRQSTDPNARFLAEFTTNRFNARGSDNTDYFEGKSLDVSSLGESSHSIDGNFTSKGNLNVTYLLPEDVKRSWFDVPRFVLDVTTTVSLTTHLNSTHVSASTFILLKTELPRTQILENLNLEDLIRVTSYAQAISFIFGSLTGSMMADIYGRRRLLYISLMCMLVFHCMVALSVSWIVFIFVRAVAVGCAGATIVISFVTVIEFVGPDWRDACTCSCFWTLGAILLSLETVATSHWRLLAVLSGGICLPLLGTYFTSTESLRWLQCQHRFKEAEWGFREVATVNSTTSPDIMTLLDQSRGCIVTNMHVKKFTYLDLFHSLDSTKWTLTLVYTCTVSSIVYFCLLWRVAEITSVARVNGFLPFVIDLPLTWSVIIVNKCLGRRWCLFLYSVASGFALLSVLVLHLTGNMDVLPSLITGLALFGKIGVTASMSLIFVLATEIYPTVTRCMGVAVALASASAGSMLVNTLIFLEQYHYTVPFVAYGAMMFSVGAVGLLFPETIRRPLKNIQQCRHRKIPLTEGARLVGRPPALWDPV